MSTAVDQATNLSIDAVVAGAEAMAEAFGLGDKTIPSTDWPIDDGDSVIVATLTGEQEGWLLLAVNNEVAGRLTSDTGRLTSGFSKALTAMVDAGAEFGATQVASAEIGKMKPQQSVEIHDGKQMCALFGVVLPAPPEPEDGPQADPEADHHGGVPGESGWPDSSSGPLAGSVDIGAGAAAFEPASLSSTGQAGFGASGPLTLLHDVEMDVTVELGRTRMPIRELLALQPGMVVEIDRVAGTPIDVLVNGRRIACGEVVVIDEEFGIRITDIVEAGARV